MKHIIYISIILLSLNVTAQKKSKKKQDAAKEVVTKDDNYKVNLKMTARCYGDSIVLRWAYQESYAWRTFNKHGFIVERLTLNVDNEVIEEAFKKLTPQPIIPWTLEEWEKKADRNDKNAMIAAQTLHGESFAVTDPSNEVSIMQGKAEETRNRFSFALFAADVSRTASNGLGLRFVDKNVNEGEKYIYKVYSPLPETFFTADTAMFIIAARDVYIPMPPIGLMAYEGDKMITLIWPRGIESTAFNIEKSDDGGKTYKKLNDLPYIRLAKGEGERNYVYVDTLAENYQKYMYRISGVTSFGDISPWSEPITVMGRDRNPPAPPTITLAQNLSHGVVKIEWEVPYITKDMKGFYIGRSTNVGGPFKPLNSKSLSKDTREYIDETAIQGGLNYYIVASIDTATNIAQSAPAYVVMPDSTPPLKPTGLAGIIDTSGVVKLHWNLGNEPDIKGYRVYYSNTPTEEENYMVLTNDALRDTTFTDTITLNTLNEIIYYSVVAVDMNHNNSEFSDVLELQKPDIVKPVSPVIKSFKVTDTTVFLAWVTSSSKDVTSQALYRKEKGNDWQVLKNLDAKTSEYTDKDIMEDKVYEYSLVATDDAGLNSEKSKPLTIRVYKTGQKPVVDAFNAKVGKDNSTVELSWDYANKGDYNFIIYRATNGSKLQMHASVKGNKNKYSDNAVFQKGKYSYAIKVVYANGDKSSLSETMEVEIN